MRDRRTQGAGPRRRRAAVSAVAALGLLSALGALCASSCASVIGVSGHRDAVTELCACPEFKDMKGCVDKATHRLEADPTAAEQWYADFTDACLCGQSIDCMSRPPLCTPCGNVQTELTRGDFLVVCTQGNEDLVHELDCFCSHCVEECKGSVTCRNGDETGGPCRDCTEQQSECPTEAIEACFPGILPQP